MAFLQSTFATSLLLLTLLVIASAADYYGYDPASAVENPVSKTDYKPYPTKSDDFEVSKPKTDYNYGYDSAPKVEKPELKTDYNPHPTKSYDFEVSKPKTNYDYGYGPAPSVEKPDLKTDYKPHPTKPDYSEESKPKTDNYDNGYGTAPKVENPTPKTDYKVDTPHPTTPNYYEVPKPKGQDELYLLPTTIGVQGVVLCKSGSNYSPIQGAVTRITCGCEDELGYETGSISVLSHATDSKGYFYTEVSLAQIESKLTVTECKAYLESSPLETCKVPTDVNYGISGALLSSYRLLENKIKLYTVGPFFCTSQPAKPVPNNGY